MESISNPESIFFCERVSHSFVPPHALNSFYISFCTPAVFYRPLDNILLIRDHHMLYILFSFHKAEMYLSIYFRLKWLLCSANGNCRRATPQTMRWIITIIYIILIIIIIFLEPLDIIFKICV